MSLSKLDKAIATIEFLTKKKKERVDELSQRLDLNEGQKIFIGQELEMIQATQTLLRFAKQDFNIELGKLPPQALDIEEAVLGAVMLEKTALSQVLEMKLMIHHFYTEAHKEIFKACCLLNDRNEGVDMRTVVFELRRLGSIGEVGGATYIAELTSKVSSAANIKFHAAIVIQQSIKREIILMGGQMIRKGYEDLTDCFELVDEFKSELFGNRFNVA